MPEREVRCLARWMLAVPDFQEPAGCLEPEAQIRQIAPQSADRRVTSNRRKGSLVIQNIAVRHVRRHGAAIRRLCMFLARPRPVGEVTVQHPLQS